MNWNWQTIQHALMAYGPRVLFCGIILIGIVGVATLTKAYAASSRSQASTSKRSIGRCGDWPAQGKIGPVMRSRPPNPRTNRRNVKNSWQTTGKLV